MFLLLPSLSLIISPQIKQNQSMMEEEVSNCLAVLNRDQNSLLRQMSDGLVDKISAQITQGRLQVSKKPRDLNMLKHSSEKGSIGEQRLKYEQVKQEKHRTLKHLHQLEKKQENLSKMIRSAEKIERNHDLSKEKSKFDEADCEKIKRILKLAKQKKYKDEKKHQEIMESFQAKMEAEREEERRKIEKIKAERNQTVMASLSLIEERQKKRKEFYEESKKRVKLLKNATYFHKIQESEDQKKRREEFERAKKLLQVNSEKHKLDFDKLKEHEKQLKLLREQRALKQQESRKIKTQMSQSRKRILSYQNFSKIHKILQEQQKARREQQFDKIERKRQLQAKIRDFNENVRQNFKPKSLTRPRQTSNSSVNFQKQHKKSRALSVFQRNQIGNRNLQTAKKLHRRKRRDSEKQRQRERMIAESHQTKYSDYLQQFKKKRRDQHYLQTKHRLKNILNSQVTITDYAAAKKVSDMAVQIESRSKKNEDERLLETILNKIQILKAFN